MNIKEAINERIKHHKDEIIVHIELYKLHNSTKQKNKIQKHHHKLNELRLIAEKMNWDYCKECGNVR